MKKSFLAIFFLICLLFSLFVYFHKNNKVHAASKTDKGVTSFITINEQDFIKAKKSGVNTIRIMLMDGDLLPKSSEYRFYSADLYYEWRLKQIKKIIKLGEKYKIKIILNVHEFPGRVIWSDANNADYSFWLPQQGANCRNIYVNTWANLTRDLRSEPNDILWFELFNEPEPFWEVPESQRSAQTFFMWEGLQDQVINEIRSVENNYKLPHRKIIATASYELSPEALRDWGSSGHEWMPSKTILSDKNIILAMHVYEPKIFTLQSSPYIVPYTGTVNDVEKTFSFIKEFQLKYPAIPILITEFGTIENKGSDLWIKQTGMMMDELNIGGLFHSIGGERYFNIREGTSQFDIDFNDFSDLRVTALKEYLSK